MGNQNDLCVARTLKRKGRCTLTKILHVHSHNYSMENASGFKMPFVFSMYRL